MSAVPDRETYTLIDTRAGIVNLQSALWQHAIVVWIVLPSVVLMEVLLPSMKVTCDTGYPDWTLSILFALEVHHIWAERRAWFAMKSMIAIPEQTIMRQLGVFRWRRAKVLLGILVEMDMYTDLTFPLLAKACDASLTAHWQQAWLHVPVVGRFAASAVHSLRFWGVAAAAVFLNLLLTGVGGLLRMKRDMYTSPEDAVREGRHGSYLRGPACFIWANAAEVAVMPSIAMFCNEMANQKKYVYDEEGDAAIATRARIDVQLGKIDKDIALHREQLILEEMEKVDSDERGYFLAVIVVNVLFGSILQLWLQTSFLALTFEDTGTEAKYKVIVSMAISVLHVVVRCNSMVHHLGLLGAGLAAFVFLFLFWALAKVYFAFHCPDHVWNLTSGCVDITDM